MRIIAGKAGRMAIRVPTAVARPTTDFVRQAVFSILGGLVDGAHVLDLFAGSGALGLEALSRGATSCEFVDDHRQACAVITENLAKTRLDGGRVVRSQVVPFLRGSRGKYDLIFADPPYCKHRGDTDHIAAIFDLGVLPALLRGPDAYFLAEISADQPTPAGAGLEARDRREYGGSAVVFYGLAPG